MCFIRKLQCVTILKYLTKEVIVLKILSVRRESSKKTENEWNVGLLRSVFIPD